MTKKIKTYILECPSGIHEGLDLPLTPQSENVVDSATYVVYTALLEEQVPQV